MDFRTDPQAAGSQGLRNNNPGNFRPGIDWEGIAGQSNNFLIFSDVQYGIRAMALNLYNNYYKNGKTTLLSFIEKYAPASDNNNPTAYATSVGSDAGIAIDEDMQLSRDRIAGILRGMMNMELGRNYSPMVSDEDLFGGIDRINKYEVIAIQTVGMVKHNVVPLVIGGSLLMSVYIYFVIKKSK